MFVMIVKSWFCQALSGFI